MHNRRKSAAPVYVWPADLTTNGRASAITATPTRPSSKDYVYVQAAELTAGVSEANEALIAAKFAGYIPKKYLSATSGTIRVMDQPVTLVTTVGIAGAPEDALVSPSLLQKAGIRFAAESDTLVTLDARHPEMAKFIKDNLVLFVSIDNDFLMMTRQFLNSNSGNNQCIFEDVKGNLVSVPNACWALMDKCNGRKKKGKKIRPLFRLADGSVYCEDTTKRAAIYKEKGQILFRGLNQGCEVSLALDLQKAEDFAKTYVVNYCPDKSELLFLDSNWLFAADSNTGALTIMYKRAVVDGMEANQLFYRNSAASPVLASCPVSGATVDTFIIETVSETNLGVRELKVENYELEIPGLKNVGLENLELELDNVELEMKNFNIGYLGLEKREIPLQEVIASFVTNAVNTAAALKADAEQFFSAWKAENSAAKAATATGEEENVSLSAVENVSRMPIILADAEQLFAKWRAARQTVAATPREDEKLSPSTAAVEDISVIPESDESRSFRIIKLEDSGDSTISALVASEESHVSLRNSSNLGSSTSFSTVSLDSCDGQESDHENTPSMPALAASAQKLLDRVGLFSASGKNEPQANGLRDNNVGRKPLGA